MGRCDGAFHGLKGSAEFPFPPTLQNSRFFGNPFSSLSIFVAWLLVRTARVDKEEGTQKLGPGRDTSVGKVLFMLGRWRQGLPRALRLAGLVYQVSSRPVREAVSKNKVNNS